VSAKAMARCLRPTERSALCFPSPYRPKKDKPDAFDQAPALWQCAKTHALEPSRVRNETLFVLN
jgi:hypothetical protein